MRLSRRLYPQALNHRLGTLAALHALPDSGRAHRALADAETTAHLLLRLQEDVAVRFAAELAGASVTHALLGQLQRTPRPRLDRGLPWTRPHGTNGPLAPGRQRDIKRGL